jgi:hypothetical protein
MFGPVTEPQPLVLAQPAIVRHEARAACPQRFFHDRVAAALDVEAVAVDEARPAPAALRRALGKAGGDVEARQRVGGLGNGVGAAERRFGQLSRCAASAASACVLAWPTRSACSCRSGALKRTTPASVWRWVKPESAAMSLSAFRAGTSTW